MDTLEVQPVISLTGLTEDLYLQAIRPPPRVPEQPPSRRYAPCLVHLKKPAVKPAFLASRGNETRLVKFATIYSLIAKETSFTVYIAIGLIEA